MLNLLPNDLLLELVFLLDLSTLRNILLSDKRIYNSYLAHFDFFWTKKYRLNFNHLIPDALVRSYNDKYRLCYNISKPLTIWTLQKKLLNNIGPVATFKLPTKGKIYRHMIKLYHEKNKLISTIFHQEEHVTYINLYTNARTYKHYTIFGQEKFSADRLSVYKIKRGLRRYIYYIARTICYRLYESDEIIVLGYYKNKSYYNTIVNFSGFTLTQIYHLLAFLYNTIDFNDITPDLKNLFLLIKNSINKNLITADDIQDFLSHLNSDIKYELKCVPCYFE